MNYTASAIAPANIAFIKYWGKKNPALNIPFTNSLSMNLSDALTTTHITFKEGLMDDKAVLNGKDVTGAPLERITQHLNHIRQLKNTSLKAEIESSNSFPTASGIASSASGFSALTVAACAALELTLSHKELSQIARLGSGSASRSIPDGFVEWNAGTNHEDSFAQSIAAPNYWQLFDLVVVVQSSEKHKTSGEGHDLAPTSPAFSQRLANLPERIDSVRNDLLNKDLASLGPLIEHEAMEMHLTTFTAVPPMTYFGPGTIEVIRELFTLREQGILGYFTIDAGANVHVITALKQLSYVENILVNTPALGARVL
jgi:diphosphomevalonate decarboxylase